MEKPVFPLSPGKYVVTGDREVTTVLTADPMDKDGAVRWELANGATIYDGNASRSPFRALHARGE